MFESLRDALTIVLLIPLSLIGTFLTYYFTGAEFGSGGYASMVMLAGLTVNAGIYMLHEYRSYGKTGVIQYVRAFNNKLVAVILTILSTVLGLVPFLIDGADEPFCFSFAIGTIGGLMFSMLPLVLYLPLCLSLTKQK